jgi:hypothetical protein
LILLKKRSGAGVRIGDNGSEGSLEWEQEHPNQPHWSPFGEAMRTISRGTGTANSAAARLTRTHAGGRKARGGGPFPTIDDGVKGVGFIEAAVRSSAPARAGSSLAERRQAAYD